VTERANLSPEGVSHSYHHSAGVASSERNSPRPVRLSIFRGIREIREIREPRLVGAGGSMLLFRATDR